MSIILTITLPIYLLIGLGFLAVRSGYVAQADVKAIGNFVVRIALPALIFVAIGSADPSEALHGGLFMAYLVSSLALFGSVVFVGRVLLGQSWSLIGLAGLGITCSNSAFVGLPLVSILYPGQAVTTFVTAMLIENAVLIPLALAIGDADENSGKTPVQAFLEGIRGLLRNPIFLSIVAALAWSFSGLTLPEPLMRPIEMLRPIAAPVSLFAVGGTIAAATTLRGVAGPGALIALGKLILHPLAFLGVAMMVPGLPDEMRMAGLVNAACPMFSIFVIFGMGFRRELMASATLLVTTCASFLTISGLLWWIGA